MSTTESPSMTAVPLSAPPAAGQLVAHYGKTYETICEGRAFILTPPNTSTSVDPKAPVSSKKSDPKGQGQGKKADDKAGQLQSVFYNPIQQFNRDLSVLAIQAFGEDWVRRKRRRNEWLRAKSGKRGKKRALEDETNGADEVAVDGAGVKKFKSEEGQTDADNDDDEEGGVLLSAAYTKASLPGNGVPAAQQIEAAEDSGPSNAETTASRPPQAPPRFRILDALSATGLRALRYAAEIPSVTSVVANDLNPKAIESMAMNIEHNGLSSKISTNLGNAVGHMYSVAFPPTASHGPHHVDQKYDVIDLDPYGTAAPFIDAALQALNNGGLLCVTCTDSAVFASTGYSEKTYALYGGMPAKGPHAHEVGLRLIINAVATSAARYGMAIEPLLSLSIDYYVRIFIRVRRSPLDVKFLASKTMLVYNCDHGCGAWTTQPLARNAAQTSKSGGHAWFKHTVGLGPTSDRLCAHCHSKMHVAGPMWAGPLHNAAFVEQILAGARTADAATYHTLPRIQGMLTTALDELSVQSSSSLAATRLPGSSDNAPAADPADDPAAADLIPSMPSHLLDHHPFFVNPSALSKVLHCTAPSDAAIKGALRHAGHVATRSHTQPGSIKTDAPWTTIWQIMREWVRQKSPIKDGALKEGSPGWHIMRVATMGSESEKKAMGDGERDDDGTTPMTVVFDEKLGRDTPHKGLVRYQQNPRENWGPMRRAK